MTKNIIETDFQRDNTSAYQLSILLGMDSLVYSIYDKENNKLLVLKTVPLGSGQSTDQSIALKEILEKEDLLQPKYGKIRITYTSPNASLVPSRLFNENESEVYLSELISGPIEDSVQVDDLDSLKMKIVYQVENQLLETVKAKFPAFQLFHISTPFLLGCLKTFPGLSKESAFACFNNESFQLALFNQGELLLYNSYACKSASDVLYFVLLAYEQYGFDPNTNPLYLAGHIVNDSDIYKILYRYIADLNFLPVPSFVQFGKGAASEDPNFYFPLHSTLLCD